jgi:hypothetical protein
MTGLLLLLCWPVAATVTGVLIGRAMRHPPHPVPGAGAPPGGPSAGAPLPALPGTGHGGLIKRIDVYADCRTEVTDHRDRSRDVVLPGSCADCRPFGTWDPDAELRDLLP